MKAAELAAAVTEGGNLLGVFLCTRTLATLRASGTSVEIDQVLSQALVKYGPAFRAMKRLVRGAKDVEPALQRLEARVRFGIDYGSPADLAEVRGAIRELLANVGFEVPKAVTGPGVVCELHGKACPDAPAGK